MTDAFSQLLHAARNPQHPQQLVFVFASRQPPADATPEQRQLHADGQGAAVFPVHCVCRHPEDVADFDAVLAEARSGVPPWDVLLVSSVAGVHGEPPTELQVDAAIELTIDGVQQGAINNFLAFDPQGRLLHLR